MLPAAAQGAKHLLNIIHIIQKRYEVCYSSSHFLFLNLTHELMGG